MKVLIVVSFAFLSIVGATSNVNEDVESVVLDDFASDFKTFIQNGINTGCDAFADIYFTGSNVTNWINNFATEITAELIEIETALPSQVSQVLSDFCEPLNYLLGVPNYITSVINLFEGLASDVRNFLYNLVGKTDIWIHQALCGNRPGTVWDYFLNLYAIFIFRVKLLNPLLNSLLCIL